MNELTEVMKSAKEALEKGYLEYDGKKFFHRISSYYKHCDNCAAQEVCCYGLSKRCMEYEAKLREKWGFGWTWKDVFLFLTERPHMKVDIAETAITKIGNHASVFTFDFEDGCWCSIHLATDVHEEGDWELQWDLNDSETYSCGGLWFNGEQIDDYDGCYDLPKHVKTALSFLGYHIDE